MRKVIFVFALILFVFFVVRLFSKEDIGTSEPAERSASRYAELILLMLNGTPTSSLGSRTDNEQGHRKATKNIMGILKAGSLYFALVFAASFVFGTVRTTWVVPRTGTRMAELMEMPLMLVVTISAARWTVLRLEVPTIPSARLEMGYFALVLMFVAEFGFFT